MNDQPCLFPTDNNCAVPNIFSRMRVLESEAKIEKLKFSPRQLQIFEGLANNQSIDQICIILGIAKDTAKSHIRKAHIKSGLNTVSIVAVCVKRGLIEVNK